MFHLLWCFYPRIHHPVFGRVPRTTAASTYFRFFYLWAFLELICHKLLCIRVELWNCKTPWSLPGVTCPFSRTWASTLFFKFKVMTDGRSDRTSLCTFVLPH
jgi:hypothetical protein